MKQEIIKRRERILWYDDPINVWDIWCIIYWVVYNWKITITRVVYVKKEKESDLSITKD
jgi:hypothetical protein